MTRSTASSALLQRGDHVDIYDVVHIVAYARFQRASNSTEVSIDCFKHIVDLAGYGEAHKTDAALSCITCIAEGRP